MDEATNVLVTVKGADMDGEEVMLSTQGELIDLEDGWLLRYDETNPDNLSVTHTYVRCEGSRVTVSRTGTMLTTIIFDRHETFVGDYPTPVGNFQLRVYASEVEAKRRGLIGHIHLVYQVGLSTAFSAADEMTTRYLDIRFTPCRR